jgi:hypothetical protein
MKKSTLGMALVIFLALPVCVYAHIVDDVTIDERFSPPSATIIIGNFNGGNPVGAALDYEVMLNNSGTWLEAFCVEDQPGPGQNDIDYTLITTDEAGDFGLVQADYSAAAWVADYYWENYLLSDPGEAGKAGAQLLIWEIVTDGVANVNFGIGAFQVVSLDLFDASAIWTAYNSASPPSDYVSKYWYLAVNPPIGPDGEIVSAPYQNYFVPVPEPSTIILLGMGLCGLGILARTRRSK